MLFDQIVENTLACLAELKLQPLALSADFSTISRTEVDGILVLNTHFLRIADKGELRWVRIHAPKIDVLTLFFFPYARWQLPVYCAEWVLFGVQPIVALLDVIDIQATNNSETIKQRLTLARQQLALPLADAIPEWFAECRSGFDIFTRPQTIEQMALLGAVHSDLIQMLKQFIMQAIEFKDIDALNQQQYLQNYKHHHRIHAPGLRLMNRSFGETWTNEYMNCFFQ